MAKNTMRIDWDDLTESVPAFLILIGIPLTFSISDGLAAGFVTYPVLKLLCGRGKEVPPLLYGVALLFVVRYVFFAV